MKTPKLIILIVLTILIEQVQSQTSQVKKNEPKSAGIYLSGGTHLALFHVFGMSLPPIQGQLDIKVDRHFFIGGAYSFDQFDFNEVGSFFSRENSFRHNIRIRLFSFFGDEHKPVMGYAGGAIGGSLWLNRQNQPIDSPIIPTVQLFVGIKTTIYKRLFNLSEFAIGAPYFLQTSFGYQF